MGLTNQNPRVVRGVVDRMEYNRGSEEHCQYQKFRPSLSLQKWKSRFLLAGNLKAVRVLDQNSPSDRSLSPLKEGWHDHVKHRILRASGRVEVKRLRLTDAEFRTKQQVN